MPSGAIQGGMRTALQFLAVTALGLAVSWAFYAWTDLFDDSNVAFFAWIAVLFAIGFVVDRRSARRRQRQQDWQSNRGLPETRRE